MKLKESSKADEITLLSYCWRHSLFGKEISTESFPVTIIDAGIYNRHGRPQFFNAKIRLNDTLWVGNILILQNASDLVPESDNNKLYQNIILVVVANKDMKEIVINGHSIPTIELKVPKMVRENYHALLTQGYTLCQAYAKDHISTLTKHSWLAAVSTEWLESQVERVRTIAETNGWENTLSILLTGEIQKNTKDIMQRIVSAKDVKELRFALLLIYNELNIEQKSDAAIEQIIVKEICPFLFACGRHQQRQTFIDRSFEILENSKRYTNTNIKKWMDAGIKNEDGLASQAIIQLHNEYCCKGDCLRCRFGYEYIRNEQNN